MSQVIAICFQFISFQFATMKNTYVLLILVFAFYSCNDSMINHKVEFNKVGSCETMSAQYHMESNIVGERYQFHQCLPEDFKGKESYTITRKGDTLVVAFDTKSEKPKTGFALTLDIDANPRYSHILIGDQILAIGEVQN